MSLTRAASVSNCQWILAWCWLRWPCHCYLSKLLRQPTSREPNIEILPVRDLDMNDRPDAEILEKLGKIDMATTAQEAFTEIVHNLLPGERLRLAALILRDLTQSQLSSVDSSDTWNEQDQSDLTTLSLQYAAELYPEDKELV